ncbi:MAG: replicative DNA helicase [Limnospira sp.]
MADNLPISPSSDRLPPQNIEAEEAILGGILLDPEAVSRVAELLRPEHFSIAAHQTIYRATLTLHLQGKPTDLMTVTSWLADQKQLDSAGGQMKLAQLVDRTVSAVNIDQYSLLVIDKFIRRRLIQAGNEIAQLGYQTATDLDVVLDQAEQRVFNVTQVQPKQDLVSISETLINTFQDIEDRSEGIALPGIPCGFYDLDAMTGGFQRSDLIIVAGRPSMGKTSFAVAIGHSIAKMQKLGIAVFSLEMSKEQLVQRLLSSEARIESNRLRSGRISQAEWEPLTEAIGNLSELPVFIDDTPNVTVTEMRSKARRLQAEQGGALGLVLIDYLQLMEGGNPDNRVQELSRITRSLKGLARELNVPVIALSQLSRGVESRTNKRPMMSDLRESGCLSGDSLVTLADSGLQVPIRELVGKSGFSVWAVNEATMKLEKATVRRVFPTGIKPIFCLKTRLGRTIKATGNHQFLTVRGWQRLDQLSAGSRIALPRCLPSSDGRSMSDAELGLLGHLIGDGCTLPRHTIQYTTREEDLANLVLSLAKQVFGDRLNPRIVKERDWYQVYLPASYHLTHQVRNPIVQWLDSMEIFGLRSHEKFIPIQVFEQSQPAIATFLRHLWSTDGCIKLLKGKSLRPVAYYSTSSQKLAVDVQSLLLRVGINARLSLISQGDKGRDQYHVTITGKYDIEKFINSVGSVGNYKQQAIREIAEYIQSYNANTNRDVIPRDIWRLYAVPAMQKSGLTTRQMQAKLHHQYCGTTLYKQNVSRERATKLAQIVNSRQIAGLAESDIYWDEICAIAPAGETEVYDLTVPGLHNFVANNIIVHNSIEQDADMVIMLYRDDYYNPDSPDRGITEIIITKHRNGPTGTVKLLFDPQYTTFRNLASGRH